MQNDNFVTNTTYDDGKAALIIHQLCELLGERDTDVVNNRNIVSKHSEGKGLYTDPYGNARFNLNFKAKIRKSCRNYGNSENSGYHSDVTLTKNSC